MMLHYWVPCGYFIILIHWSSMIRCHAYFCTVESVISFMKLRQKPMWLIDSTRSMWPWGPWIFLLMYIWWSKYILGTVWIAWCWRFEATGRSIECGSNVEDWEMMYARDPLKKLYMNIWHLCHSCCKLRFISLFYDIWASQLVEFVHINRNVWESLFEIWRNL
jgi:hypothetical protein